MVYKFRVILSKTNILTRLASVFRYISQRDRTFFFLAIPLREVTEILKSEND